MNYFSLRIDGSDLHQKITLEQVYAALREEFLNRSSQSDMVVMLTNGAGFRHVEHLTTTSLCAILKTFDAMKRFFCHASHGRLLIFCRNQSEPVLAFPPLSGPCKDQSCSLLRSVSLHETRISGGARRESIFCQPEP